MNFAQFAAQAEDVGAVFSAGEMLCVLQPSLEFCSQISVCLQGEHHPFYLPACGTWEEQAE